MSLLRPAAANPAAVPQMTPEQEALHRREVRRLKKLLLAVMAVSATNIVLLHKAQCWWPFPKSGCEARKVEREKKK